MRGNSDAKKWRLESLGNRYNIEKYKFLLRYFEDNTFYYDGERVWKTRRINSHKQLTDLDAHIEAGEVTSRGYKRIHFNKVSGYEHVLIYAYLNGIDSLESIECIDHVNGIKTDNRQSNLEGVTVHENNLRAKLNGQLRPLFGEDNGYCKLTDVEVRLIRALYECGISQHKIAELAEVSQGHISGIVTGKKRGAQPTESTY
jgi:hypothetical protein